MQIRSLAAFPGLFLLASLASVDVQSGLILAGSHIPTPTGPGLGSVAIVPPPTTSPRLYNLLKTFEGPSGAYIDLKFTVQDSGAITEYQFDETVQNLTSFQWADFHHELGFIHATTGQFVLASGGLEFVLAPAPTSSKFTLDSSQANALWWLDALVPPNSTTFSFGIRVPDSANLPSFVNVQPAVGGQAARWEFVLRQYPTPEPATLALLAAGVAGIVSGRRRTPRS